MNYHRKYILSTQNTSMLCCSMTHVTQQTVALNYRYPFPISWQFTTCMIRNDQERKQPNCVACVIQIGDCSIEQANEETYLPFNALTLYKFTFKIWVTAGYKLN